MREVEIKNENMSRERSHVTKLHRHRNSGSLQVNTEGSDREPDDTVASNGQGESDESDDEDRVPSESEGDLSSEDIGSDEIQSEGGHDSFGFADL
jgi:hypothetical protein